MNVLLPATGTFILLLLARDIAITVFHPDGHGGPLTRRLSPLVWGIWRDVAPRGERDRWLAAGGPLLALLAPAVWALLLVAGFALIYYPSVVGFLASPGSLRSAWAEALYFSGVAAATLGTGDIVPDAIPVRLLSVVQAFSGFALLSAALSYILAIYGENGRKMTLAAELDMHRDVLAGPPEARAARDLWFEHVARELAHIRHTHAQYPILHYFRPQEGSSSLALQLGLLVRLGARAETRDAPDQPVPHGERVMLRALEQYLEATDRRFVPGGPKDQGSDSMEGRHVRLLRFLGYASAASDSDSPNPGNPLRDRANEPANAEGSSAGR